MSKSVYIVTRDVDSSWAEDRGMEILKVFSTWRKAAHWVQKESNRNPDYVYSLDMWKVGG